MFKIMYSEIGGCIDGNDAPQVHEADSGGDEEGPDDTQNSPTQQPLKHQYNDGDLVEFINSSVQIFIIRQISFKQIMERNKSTTTLKHHLDPQTLRFKDLSMAQLLHFKSLDRIHALSPNFNCAKDKQNINHNQPSKTNKNQHKDSRKSKLKLEDMHIEHYEQFKGLLTNKAKETLERKLASENILCEGMSKDGLYKIQSKILHGGELKKAGEEEWKASFKARNQKLEEKSTKNPITMKVDSMKESKTSKKNHGIIKGYAVNTNEGINRNYNEDRVSIILNINKNGVKSFFFAIYDGHGGNNCCDFLNEHLHEYILNSKKFPSHPKQAIMDGIKLAEKNFLAKVKNNYTNTSELDRSGSCLILALFVGDECYVANVGDSRAIMSANSGRSLCSLSRDHKPTDEKEQLRIIQSGGKIYRTQMKKIKESEDKPIIGPLRVHPGKLSITRTIGDIEAKDSEFGGIGNCVIFEPQICQYRLQGNQDFMILGCDGIFERMGSGQVIDEGWKAIKKTKTNIHEACGNAAYWVLRKSMLKRSTDNVTAIVISFRELGLEGDFQYRSI